ncbi:MAG: GNAT family N-acetyltransferase [Paludibacterium sp.]|uniref:GNAT family N-acetyltransferase n=1 Tax=Paludibacterium sp. TaxID=1917523 RepID=UPI0025E542C5|nr:GNAT family N-acetyltransferase [Paludibacterium sp.]MBV8049236.1 GNAT family N-acetyltransferase [Paludibacterium sp.]MBV8646680.1 GNAT family N-acetyltransferase [Paludibacterium sp.]
MPTLTIRHSRPTDAEAVRDIYACPSVQAGTLQLPYPSLELWQQRVGEHRPNHYSLVAERDGRVVGQLGLEVNANPRRKHAAHFGIGVMESEQGQGIGSRLLAAAIDLADNWLNVTRLELTVYIDNPAAIALYRKFGFVIEGESVGYAFRQGEFVNVFHMARLRA